MLEVFSCFYGLLPLGLNHPLQGPHLGLSKSMFLNHLEETLASLAGLEISLSHSEAHGPVACIGERAGSEVHKPTHRYVIVETVENCGRQPAAFLGDFGEPIFGRSFSLCCVLVPPNILIRHIIYVSCVQGNPSLDIDLLGAGSIRALQMVQDPAQSVLHVKHTVLQVVELINHDLGGLRRHFHFCWQKMSS